MDTSLLRRYGTPTILFVIILGLWEMYIAIYDVSLLLLPTPRQVVGEYVQNFVKLNTFALNTLIEAFAGLVLATLLSIVAAGATFRFTKTSKMLENYSALAKSLPTVAIYPICTVFFGIGTEAIIAIVTVGLFPIMFLYALRGFTGVSEHDALFDSLAARTIERFIDLVLPRSVSYLMAGLKSAAPTAIIITIVAEYFGGSVTTLGAYIRRESANLHTVEMWGAIFSSCILGLLVFGVVVVLDRHFTRWRPE